MTGSRPEPTTEDILPEVWRVVEELKRLTEGLERSLDAARKKDTDGPDDT